MSYKTIIVSNRLPVTLERDAKSGELRGKPSAGGLATALDSVHNTKDSTSVWVGWAGPVVAEEAELHKALNPLRLVPVMISAEEVSAYYDGFSNGVLWPLCHYLIEKISFDHSDFWAAYCTVNQRFADVIKTIYQDGDLIWVQDYQLMLLPSMLRTMIPSSTIGYFHHIPFPSSEVFRLTPARKNLVTGLLGADLVGFHTLAYGRHFFHTCDMLTEATPSTDDDVLEYDARHVRVSAFPIGVDNDSWQKTAMSEAVQTRTAELRREFSGRKTILSVDRFDYTKGIVRRLLAFQRLFKDHPEMMDAVHIIQVLVPTRENVDAYVEHQQEVLEMAGRINAQQGSVTKAVLHIVHRSVPREELVALYCAADIMVVTPLRDGMNLVAKEYVATRVNNDGVLVLSEFTGAAAQLRDAVMINPYDVQSTSDSLFASINMPLAEQQRRMRALRFNVRDSNVTRWASAFITALESTRDVHSRRSSSSALPALGMPNVTEAVSALARNNSPVAVFVDYDGTLVPFASRPNLAFPDRELLSLLTHLADRVELHVASGRTHESLARFVGKVPHTTLHAEHGLFTRAADSDTWESRLTPLPPAWKTDVLGIMRDAADRSNGALVEEKTAAVVFHYRNVKQRVARRFVSELKTRLLALPSSNEFELLDGVCVLEVRPAGINKGCIVTDWLARVTAQNAATASPPPLPTIVCIGDDHTDEDMFAMCPPNAITVKVGEEESVARFRVADHLAVRELLRHLL